MIWSGPREIAGGGLRLREVVPEDAAILYRWRMGPDSRLQFRFTGEVSFPEHQAYVQRYFQPGNDDRWFIIEQGEADGEPVGAIALYEFSPDGTAAEWGRFVIDPGHRRRGLGRRGLELLIAHAREIGVRDLRCEVLAGNTAAEGLYHRLGFAETGSYEHGGRIFRQLALRLTPDR